MWLLPMRLLCLYPLAAAPGFGSSTTGEVGEFLLLLLLLLLDIRVRVSVSSPSYLSQLQQA
jgi:hypothetical protein